jgi:proteasome assembly chaperone 2
MLFPRDPDRKPIESTPTYHIAPPNTPSLESTPLHNLLRLPIPAYTSPVSQHPGRPVAESDIPFISGGGLTRRVLSSLGESWTVPTAALLQFVLEGDNRADAHLFAAVVAKVLGIEESIKAWKRPSSWARGLFGSPPDQTLYG